MNQKSVRERYTGTIAAGLLLLAALYLTSLHSYLLFHSVVELFTVVVAAGIFVIAWNARSYIQNNYLVFVGIASVFIAVLDLFHTLAYQGMGVFAGDTANLATQLWIAGRYLQSVSWLLAPLFLSRKLRPALVAAIYGLVTALLLLSIFYWQNFPTAYVTGVGLTVFKKASEYVISLIFVGAIGLLVWKRRAFDPGVERLLAVSLLLSIASEIAFTSYVNVYGPANMIGHLLRWSAYYLLYKAIIETGLVKPYSIFLRNLKRSDDELRSHAADLQTRNDELDAYAHTVAHDLKNPLTIITAAADVVNTVRNLTPAEIQEYLQQIKDTALEMSSIIDDLLLLAEVRSVDVPLGPVDMQDIVRTVQKRLDFLLKKYRARLVLPAAWPGAIGYAPWIQEVWANYISNALKYGGPSPKIELGASLAAGGMVRFWAQDHGPGVPADSASLFIPFSQLRSRRRDGHGLGLSIVLHIVQKLGGEVGVENVQGKGALFYFMLPSSQTPRGITEGALPPATTT